MKTLPVADEEGVDGDTGASPGRRARKPCVCNSARGGTGNGMRGFSLLLLITGYRMATVCK